MGLRQPFHLTIGGQRPGAQNNAWSIDMDGNAYFAGTLSAGTIAPPTTQAFTNITVGDGTAAVPSISFTADADSGFYRVGSNRVGIAAGGSNIGSFLFTGGITTKSELFLNTDGASVAFGISEDASMARSAAGVFKFGNAAATYDNEASLGTTSLRLANVCSVIFTAGSATTLMTTSTALTDYAAAQLATMTNGPTAGNPTKWIAINDNGVTRRIPAW